MNGESIKLFGEFTLDLTRGCVLRGGHQVHLRPQAYEVLKYLAANKGRLISKDQLIQEVWQGRAVTDGSLGKCIEEIREALGQHARLYVRNVRGRGYIFEPEEQAPSSSEWAERIDVVRLLVEEEAHENERPFTLRRRNSLHAQQKANVSPVGLRLPKAVRFAVTAVIAIVILASVAYYFLSAPTGPARTSNVKSLAVLPFKLLGGQSAHEYLGLGMADTLITRLSNLREMKVRPTSSVIKYGDSEKETIEIGRELGVESVLEGSIQLSGSRMRVTVRLVSVKDQTPLWADKFDEEFTDIFSVEDSISQRVAEKLTHKLSSEERTALFKHYTENTEAHLLTLSGRYQLEKRVPEVTLKAIEFFQKAIEKDPNYALAYANIAESYFNLTVTGYMRPRDAFPKAREAATTALRIDPQLAEAHFSLATYNFFHEWDWAAAELEFKRAFEINPNYAAPHELYGHLLSNLGRHEAALSESDRALELNPLSLISNAIRGQILMFAGKYDDATAHLQRAIDLEPGFWIFHLVLGKVYERKRLYPQAIAEFQRAWELSGAPEPKSFLGYTYAVSDNISEARKLLDELKEMSYRRYLAPKHIALVYAGLREKEAMYSWLEKAYEDRDISMTFIKVEPRWDEYRSEPRFAELVRKVGFEQ